MDAARDRRPRRARRPARRPAAARLHGRSGRRCARSRWSTTSCAAPTSCPPAGSTCRRAAPSACERSDDEALFAHTVGHDSLKRFLFPPQLAIWRARRGATEGSRSSAPEPPPRYAFLGVRSCDLHAVAIQDRVFIGDRYVDPDYEARRRDAFFVAVNCGPRRRHVLLRVDGHRPAGRPRGYDLALTELLDERRPPLRRGGRQRARRRGARRRSRTARAEGDERGAPTATAERARASMGRTLDITDIRDLLQANAEHPRWDEVADRCLSCGNCTLVCPTCFCSTAEDTHRPGRRRGRAHAVVGLVLHARALLRPRRQRARGPGRSRYRQWMTHKLSTWIDQFGTSGCVGCGRCITWCPVAIDITEETAAIRARLRRRHATIEELLAEVPALRALAPEHRERDRRLRAQPRLRTPASGSCARASRRMPSTSSARAPWRSRPRVPRRGAGDRSRPCTTATCSAGHGSCRRTARRSTRARSGTTHAMAIDGACLRGKCEADPALGYDLLKLVATVFVERLQDTRLRLLDLYGKVGRWLTCRAAVPASPTSSARPPTRGRCDSSRPSARRAALRPGPVRDALRVRRRRGADLGQRASATTARSCTPMRAVGAVTAALCAAEPGDVLGVRGPFGTAWPLREAEGHDVVVVAGGIGLAPLRPVVHDAARAPRALRRVSRPLRRALARRAALRRRARALARRFDVDVDVTVDARRRRLARARRGGHRA